VRANCTNSRLGPCCRWKPIVLLAQHSHDWQSARETSHVRASFGKAHWDTLARATKLTNSWQSTTSTKPASRDRRWRSRVTRSLSSAAQIKWGRSRRRHIVRSRRGSSIGWCASNARPAVCYSTHLTHSQGAGRFSRTVATAQSQDGEHERIDEGRKRVLAIVAGIPVARDPKTTDDLFDCRSSPRTESLVAAAVQWADRIMNKIDGVFGNSSGDGKRWPRT